MSSNPWFTSSLDLALTTSFTSVRMPKTLVAIRRDMADRSVLVKESKVDRRHSFRDVETSDKVVEVLRLWKILNTVAAGEELTGETGISHCRRLVADCSMLSKELDASFVSPKAENMELAIPWRLVELRALRIR